MFRSARVRFDSNQRRKLESRGGNASSTTATIGGEKNASVSGRHGKARRPMTSSDEGFDAGDGYVYNLLTPRGSRPRGKINGFVIFTRCAHVAAAFPFPRAWQIENICDF